MALISMIRFWILFFSGKVSFPNTYKDQWIQMDDGVKFKIFRHMKRKATESNDEGAVFVVRFKFNTLSHEANQRASRIPIPMIGGGPGFRDKIWMIDWETGYWQGVYQWDSEDAVARYKKSFVLGIMNARAVEQTLTYWTLPNTQLESFIDERLQRNDQKDTPNTSLE